MSTVSNETPKLSASAFASVVTMRRVVPAGLKYKA
jgi:hypothetical protein